MDFLELFVDFAEGGIHILFLCLGLPKKDKECVVSASLYSFTILDFGQV